MFGADLFAVHPSIKPKGLCLSNLHCCKVRVVDGCAVRDIDREIHESVAEVSGFHVYEHLQYG
jgi:hypothetical protein